ncbi:MAG: iron-containing alcohol dehydrogenase [Muribaculaceae bacterium]|nr:iron-containing alcohol dehydrogenase [Muribaculaceae bacterium]
MNNFTFHSPTESVFGKDTQKQTGKLIKQYGGGKVLVVYGGGSAERSGLIKDVTDALEEENISYAILKGVRPNPTDDKVYEGIALAVREGVNFILAVGGGSVIDTAKAIAMGAVYPGDFWDFFKGSASPVAAIPVGVVLTIPAAGSEGSPNSVITRIDGLHKLSCRCQLTRPRFAILNPELTMTLPWEQTAYGITDMLCHIFERYFSNTTAQLVNAYSEAIMREVMDHALSLKINPEDYEARADVMWAGTLAHNGLCGVGKEEDWATHRMEHEVSAIYDVPHGAGLACIAPAWMTFVARKNPGMVWKFAINVMSVNPEGRDTDHIIEEGIALLKDFYHDLGLTTSLTELIGKEPDIDALVKSLEGNMGKTLGFYVPLSMDDCREIYKLAL